MLRRSPDCLRASLYRATFPALLLCCSAVAAQDSEVARIRRRAQETVSRGHYQSSLEFGEHGERITREPRSDPFQPERELPGAREGAGVSREVARFWLYTVLAVVGVFVVLAVIGLFRDRARGGTSAKEDPRRPQVHSPGGVSDAPPGEPLAEADRLAASGQLEEAVHALLLEAIRLLSRELGHPKASSTSRELLGLYALEDRRRRSFEALVLAVESVLFGGRPIHPDAYQACRGHFGVVAARTLP